MEADGPAEEEVKMADDEGARGASEPRRSTLDAEETARFRAVCIENHARVHNVLARCGVGEEARPDLVQEVWFAFYRRLLEHDFPDDPARELDAIAAGKASNQVRGARRDVVSVGLPSSSQLPPVSELDVDKALDLAKLARYLRDHLTPAHRAVVDALVLDQMSHQEAAEKLDLNRSTLTMRFKTAREVLWALAVKVLPPSQRWTR